MKLFENDCCNNPSLNFHTYRHILSCLAVVLQDDGDVHVDDDEEADDQVSKKVGYCHDGIPAVPLVPGLWVG